MLAAAAMLSAGLVACGGTPGGSGGGSAAGSDPAPAARAGSGPATTAPMPTLHGGEMVGWTATELHHRLGLPLLTFIELPAEVWRYSTPACVVLVFLYPADGMPGSQPVVHHVEILPRAGVTARDSAHCLQQIEEMRTV